MTEPATSDEVRAAAYRVRHDVGKAARFSAPKESEGDAERLRERLARDLLGARRAEGKTLSLPEVFDAVAAAEGELLARAGLGAPLDAVARGVERVRALLPRLPALDGNDLARLDEATRDVARAASELLRLARGGGSA